VISWFTDGNLPLVYLSMSVWNADQIYPSVNSSVSVAATVKCRRIKSVGKAVNECLKYRPSLSVCKCVGECSNAKGLIPSVKILVLVFYKFVFKKLFRIYNIKLYKLMVIKTNYANKIYIKHKKKNQS
jgi:hypothetical protein